jgi:uncharacterized protein DUF1996
MARHKMPLRTKRRLIAAATAAVAIVGTGVIIGVNGNASAKDSGVADVANQQCLPDVNAPTSTKAPEPAPPQDSSTAPAPPSESSTDPAPPTESSPADTPPADTPPADTPPADPAPPQGNAPATYNHHHGGQVVPAAAQPAPPGASAATAPDEKGAAPPATPDPQPQAQDVQQFQAPNCTDQFGPSPQDFVNIRKVTRSNIDPKPGRNASKGTFSSRCGTNQNKHNNPDNFIVAPGVKNGAHHLHDYVGNLSADGSSTNDSLAAAGTTCGNGDKSTYYWPVIRVRDKKGGGTASEPENPHNIGNVVQPRSVSLLFRGNAQSKVVAMPQFMRDITGDAKAAINGGANGNAKWTCTGFTNRFTTKYPICPRGSQLQRVLDFASCWDGKNIDSTNHRTHVVFPDKTGACPAGTKAIPQLRMTLTYDLPRRALFAVDAFPEVLHNPITDHGDFVNVMPADLMNRAVSCINSGRNC